MEALDKIKLLAKQEYTQQKPGIQRISKLLAKLGNPQNTYPAIHIAGTNGKGSTANMLSSILVAAGYQVGLYTSPHFIDCRERIRINNQLISKRAFASCLAKILALPEAAELTYFEILTAVAFSYFAEQKIAILICEVGLGGKLDATNVLKNKLVNIITSIDYDHKEFLGNTLFAIAKAKAGIITQVPTVIYSGHRSLDNELSKMCRSKKARGFFLNKHFHVAYLRSDWEKQQQFFNYTGLQRTYENLPLSLLGEHQVRNAGLALASLELISDFFPVSTAALYQGLKNTYWPGRFEIVPCQKCTFVLDGAHNVAGVKAFAKTWQSSIYAKQQHVFIISMLRDKDYKKMCAILQKLAQRVVILNLNSERRLQANILVQEWQKYLPDDKIMVIDSLNELSTQGVQVVCVTGSLYAISEARQYVKNHC